MEEIAESLITEEINFISVSEAADITGVTCETIRSLCKKGAIRYQLRGYLYYPCKEDIIRCANTIYRIQSLEVDIRDLKNKLAKERRELLKKIEATKRQLETINVSPIRLQRLEDLVYALLKHYEKKNGENLNEREIKILFKMFHGEDTSIIANELQISRERVRQIWTRILRIIATTKNELELKDEEIASLKQTIQHIDNKISYNFPEEKPQDDRTNVDLFFGTLESCGFTPRTINGLHQANIETIYELIDHSRRDIELIPHLGKKSLNEIDIWLEIHGLDYGMHGVDMSKLKAILNNH